MHSFNKLPSYNGDKELAGLQILKFICAIMVVQIHTYSVIGKYILPLCRIAVPVFFVISGYFMVSNNGIISSKKVIGIFVKIFKIAVFATISYISFDVLIKLLSNHSLDNYIKPSYWLYEFLFGTSARGHLWYLTSYLQTLLVIYTLLRIKKFSLLFLIVPIGITINLLIGSYGFIIFDNDNSLLLSRNTLTIAIPCVMTGIFIRIYESYCPSQKIIFIGLISSVIMLYIEHVAIKHSAGDIIIMTMPVAVLTFILFLRFNPRSRYLVVIESWGKKHSLDIYLWHPMIATIYWYFRAHLGLHPGVDTVAISFITLSISILLSPVTLPNKCIKYIRETISKG